MQKQSKYLMVRINERDKQTLKELAHEEGMNMSKFVKTRLLWSNQNSSRKKKT